jgi:hypothetical protein
MLGTDENSLAISMPIVFSLRVDARHDLKGIRWHESHQTYESLSRLGYLDTICFLRCPQRHRRGVAYLRWT